ncbi:MAG: ATP-dependent helicase HrpB [Acidimicrobiia bacterium]
MPELPAEVRGLPVVEALPALRDAVRDRGRAVLHAPPGAGKTTVVPLVLLAEPWCTGTVLVLEPRRIAVRSAARRLAQLLGEGPGATVGWRMRQDTLVSERTRIEVVTEGVLTRRLQRDPELAGVSAVVFDEFHERSLDADLGLALVTEVVEALRPELRVVVMSATLDVAPVADLLDAPVVRSEGRAFPVDVVHVDPGPAPDRRRAVEAALVPAVRRALGEQDGDVLVFLPGAAEIQRAQRALGDLGPGVAVRPLLGSMPSADQDAAIAPSPPGTRKVVLATSVAETSLTIEGVTAVVDSGLRRVPRLDPGTGMSRLVTLPVTTAEAEQRAGRAGRLGPGRAYRLWHPAEDAGRRRHPEPEIEVADLTPLALDLAAWGAQVDDLAWLTAPPAGHLAAARSVLRRLGALDADGTITAHGRRLATLPLHPRLGHLLVRGAELGHGSLAADLAAALHEDGLRRRDRTDVAERLRALGDRRDPAAARARRDAARFLDEVGGDRGRRDTGAVGLLAALAFPDRIGRRRPGGRGEVLLADGRAATFPSTDPLADAEWVVVVEHDGDPTRARTREAAAIDEGVVRLVAGDDVEVVDEVRWDERRGEVVARRLERFGAVTLSEGPLAEPPAEAVRSALLDGLRAEGLGLLGWDDEVRRLQARLGFLHRLDPDRWADVSDAALLDDAEARLAPLLAGPRRADDLRRIDGREVLLAGLGWRERSAIDELAPERLEVPSGNRHRVDYDADPPVLAVKLQELFGSTETPAVGGGRVPVVLHLLSPAGRPLQVTQDLASFWDGAYAQVRAEMRGRYPKHPWPDDPRAATPTSATKRRR